MEAHVLQENFVVTDASCVTWPRNDFKRNFSASSFQRQSQTRVAHAPIFFYCFFSVVFVLHYLCADKNAGVLKKICKSFFFYRCNFWCTKVLCDFQNKFFFRSEPSFAFNEVIIAGIKICLLHYNLTFMA